MIDQKEKNLIYRIMKLRLRLHFGLVMLLLLILFAVFIITTYISGNLF